MADDVVEPGPENNWEGYVPKFLYKQNAPKDRSESRKVEELLEPGAVVRPKTWSATATKEIHHDAQTTLNNCVGMTTAYIVGQSMLMRGDQTDPTVTLSNLMPWNEAKQVENTLGQNVGIDNGDSLTVTAKNGICLFTLLPTTNTAADYSAMPSAVALADASGRKGITFYQAATFDALLTAAGTLNSGPVLFSCAVYPPFENPLPTGYCASVFGGSLLGYHDIALKAYDDNQQLVWLQNWWPNMTADDTWILTYAQVAQIFTEGWVAQLWPQTTPQPAPAPVSNFVPTGVAAPFWNWVLAGNPIQPTLNAGWGAWFNSKGCA